MTDILILSSIPASTDYGAGVDSAQSFTFKERVPEEKLRAHVAEFVSVLSKVLEDLPYTNSGFHVDAIELSAVMGADGRLGILGSSIGAKTEGALKFVFKRAPTDTAA